MNNKSSLLITSSLPSCVLNLMWKTQLSSSSSQPLLLGTGGVIFSTYFANDIDAFSIIESVFVCVCVCVCVCAGGEVCVCMCACIYACM